MDKKIIILSILSVLIIILSLTAISAKVYSEPGTHYLFPMNDYQKAVEYANNYYPIYEAEIPDTNEGNVVGQTIIIDNQTRIIIEDKNASTVYHELYHARYGAGEEKADDYADKMLKKD